MTKPLDSARWANLSFPAADGDEHPNEPGVSRRKKVDLSATVTLSGDALAALLEEVKRIQSAGEAPRDLAGDLAVQDDGDQPVESDSRPWPIYR